MNSTFKYLAVVALAALFTACQQTPGEQGSTTSASTAAQADKDTLPPTNIAFDDTLHAFGQITKGEKVTHVFKFTNTGDKPLKISDVKPSCGCTSPDWTKDAIAPGQQGSITLVYSSENGNGVIHKEATITANTVPANRKLVFTGTVVDPKK